MTKNSDITQILIGNRQYSVSLLDDHDFVIYLQQCNCDIDAINDVKSFIDYDDQVICVREKLKNDHRQELILHELLHACLEDSGIIQNDATESFIRALSPRLSSLLSNKDFQKIVL